jgi:ABC-type phosphate transport system substrate-binding protein
MVALALLLLLLATPGSDAGDPLAVIVHPARRGTLSADDVAHIYLRRKRFWENGTPIVPLNLPSGTPLRQRFSTTVLGQSDAQLALYWNRQYFYGILPPATLVSTEAVQRYVASDPNAIGYVPASEVGESVRVLLRLE